MMSNLLPPLSNEIKDLLDAAQPSTYTSIKEEIMKSTPNCKQKEFAKPFNNKELESRKPTQLLHRMKEPMVSQQTDESYLKEAFFGKLPNGAQKLLSAVKALLS